MKRSARQGQSRYEKIYAVVRRIPRGRVATYGQVAQLAGYDGQARQVGYALHALQSATVVPWQRVVNAKGAISLAPMRGGVTQRMLLEREGVGFSGDRIQLKEFAWRPRR